MGDEKVADLAALFTEVTFQSGFPGDIIYLEAHRFLLARQDEVPTTIKIPGPRDRLLLDYRCLPSILPS